MAKKHKTELDVDPTSIPVAEEEVEESPKPSPVKFEAEGEEGEEESKPKRKLTKKAIIILAVGISGFLSLIATIVAGYFYFSKEEEPVAQQVVEPAKPEPVQKAPVTFEKMINLGLEPFIIPIEKNGEKHFWRIAFSIQLSNEETIDEIEENSSIIREAIFLFLTTHEIEDFSDQKKRSRTIYDMEILLDRSLQTGRVKSITITEFNIM